MEWTPKAASAHAKTSTPSHIGARFSLRTFLIFGLIGALPLCTTSAIAQDEDESGGEVQTTAEEANDALSVYVIAIPMEEELTTVAARAGSAARAALRQIETINWQTPDARFLGYDPTTLTVLDNARRKLDEGRQAYLNFELDRAIELLSSAVEDFDAAAAALEDPNDLGNALLFLGASYAFNSNRRQAINTFRRLHRQMPHIQPDPNTFNPQIVSLYERAAPPDRTRPRARISVQSNPENAIAYVDFIPRGHTPVEVEGLMSGEHIVRVTRPGAIPFVEPIRARPGRAASSDGFLVDHEGFESLADLLQDVPTASIDAINDDNPIHQIAEILEVDRIGILRVSSANEDNVNLELLIFNREDGRRLVRNSGDIRASLGEYEAGVNQLVTASIGAALRPTRAVEVERPPIIDTTSSATDDDADDGTSGTLTEQWWFWSIVGATAVAIGVGIAVGASVADQAPALGNDPGGQVILEF